MSIHGTNRPSPTRVDRGAELASYGLLAAVAVAVVLVISILIVPPGPTGDGRTLYAVLAGVAGLFCLLRAERPTADPDHKEQHP